jgi:hypothetical protein
MRLDEALLADYCETFALMRRLGFNGITIWGLYVANNWPPDIRSAVQSERGQLVERLIASAHEEGIKVLSGLGTYSLGFAEIIRANPKLSGGNPDALCPSQPASHEWMQRVVDFMFERFEIDGVSMQSADQGRCQCAACAELGDVHYHASLIARTAQFIRARWPAKVLGMSNWGLPFGNPKDKGALVGMSRHLDYMIDHNDSARGAGRQYRRELVKSLACAFGTSGGPVVEPPQHWDREQWLLPTCRRVHQHLAVLAADGGRAVEFFFHILANPSSELTLHVAGRTLADPGTRLEQHVAAAVDELYQPLSAEARDGVAQWFLAAEDAYFRHLPGELCSTISLEPLVGNRPGPPVYLSERLDRPQREAYSRDLRRLAGEFQNLRPQLRSPGRVERIDACLRRVQADLKQL